jgi:hypothetical protein
MQPWIDRGRELMADPPPPREPWRERGEELARGEL